MKLINERDRQRSGSHLLCGNVACRIPLESPYTVVELSAWSGQSFQSVICEKCRAAIGGVGSRVEIDRETQYG
jgi:hypothetical protein